MPVLPVLDLKQGQVVRGIAGRRDEYRPIVSRLTPSSLPRKVARALHEQYGFAEFYVADLDAIGGAAPARSLYEGLHADGFGLWVDAGVRTADEALGLRALNVNAVVVGLETVAGPQALREILQTLGPDRVVFSLDLKGGKPLGDLSQWDARDAWGIAQHSLAEGVSRLIVLDLARVGAGAGVGTEDLCRRLRHAHPAVEITAGGGVRGPGDVKALYAAGADNVLVASALHDGRLTRDDV